MSSKEPVFDKEFIEKLKAFLELRDEEKKEALKEAYDKFREKYFWHEDCAEDEYYDFDEHRCKKKLVDPHSCEDPNAEYNEVLGKCVCKKFFTLDPVTGKCVPVQVVVELPKDANGISKLYKDKDGGAFIGSDHFTEEEFQRNYASGKPSENSYENEYKDKTKLENIEVTYYTQINGFKKEADTISIKLLGGDHNDKSKSKWLIFQLDTDGSKDDNFQIEDPHPKNHDNHQSTLFTIGESLVGKPIGLKAITYIDAEGKRHAETWVDFPTSLDTPANKWRKYIDIQDVLKLSHGFANATGGNVLLRIDGTKKGSMPTTKFQSLREITFEQNTTGPTIPIPPTEPPVEPPTTPPTGEGTLDKDGIMIPFKLTGKSVALTTGNDHRNGQRYSVNHHFKNYMVVGYFKLGKGQKQIEHKTDGPNHGSCKKLPECCWAEVDWLIEPKVHDNGRKTVSGEMYISSEWPHPENHPPPKEQASSKIIEGLKAGNWVGFGTAAFQDGEFRHIQGFGDVNPFKEDGTPANNWIVGVNEIDKGQITNPELAKREMPVDFDEGMESEIRMHGATSHDCEIKWAKVYEIVPPS
jgi:hypothetical protein